MKKFISIGGVALLIAIVALFFPWKGASPLGGSTSASWSAASFKVGSTEVISAARALSNIVSVSVTGAVVSEATSYGNSGLSTTTNGAGTFTAAQLCDNDRIIALPNVGAVTLSVASASDMFADCIPNPGDVREVFFSNATTAAIALTLADTGVNTEHVEEEGATTVIDGTEFGKLIFRNLDDTTMIFEVEVLQVAD